MFSILRVYYQLTLMPRQIWPITTPYIRTYRLPTPLLIFQIALIVGSFVTGFLLSPFLVLSRNNAQRPVHRLRFPQEKERNRRYYALAFYVGTVLIVGTMVGFWTRWCLRGRDPWLWAIFWILEGKNKWTRPVLLAYWALLGSISVAGWSRQLSRTRRKRPRGRLPSISESPVPAPCTVATNSIQEAVTPLEPAPAISPTSIAMTFPTAFSNMATFPNLPNGPNMTNVATDLLDAADKHVPTLSLNARRKFFHGLAVLMFIPGVAIDVSFWQLLLAKRFILICAARIHSSFFRSSVCSLHICGICAVFRNLSVWSCAACVYERVFGPERQRHCDSESFLFTDWVCKLVVA